MQNPRNTRRQTWLTTYRLVTMAALVAIVIMGAILLSRSFAPITTTQASKIERATTLLENVGFTNPIYQGITFGAEAQFPTFRATALNGKSIDLFIRTTGNGGWEIQPVGTFKTINSADDLARVAQDAVSNWENIPSSIKPRTDGAYGEYESRKYDYDLLAQYKPDASYWKTPRDETSGWPSK